MTNFSPPHAHLMDGSSSNASGPTEEVSPLEVLLDLPWEKVLTDLPVRVYNVLVDSGFTTLREVVSEMNNGAEILLGMRNFGRKSHSDLWWALKNAMLPTVELSKAEASETLAGALPARLEQQGVALDRPWQESLPGLSKRVQNVLNEHFESLHQVVVAVEEHSPELLKLQNFGRRSLAELREALETVAEFGPGFYRYGKSVSPPVNLDELIARALEALPAGEGRLLARRILDGTTLVQLGHECGLTRERMRQKIKVILERLGERFGYAAREMMAGVIDATGKAGGLLHRQTVEALLGASDLTRVLLGLLIAGQDAFRIWQVEYLTSLSSEQLGERFSAWRKRLWGGRRSEYSLLEAQEIAAREIGFDLDPAVLAHLLTTRLGAKISEDGLVTRARPRVSDQLAKILRAAGTPLHFTEIAGLYLSTSSPEALAELSGGSEGEGARDDSDPRSNRRAYERTLQSALAKHDDIYCCGRGTYVHSTALPFPQARLDEIVDLCVSRLQGETGAVSTGYLLRILDQAGCREPGLNKYLLKEALSRHPEILGLRKFRVGYIPSYSEYGQTLQDRVGVVLSAAEGPLSTDEVWRRLPRGAEYLPVGVGMCLRGAPFALNLGDGRYCHLESLGLSEAQRSRLVDLALGLLPPDGSPISCARLLNHLGPRSAELGIAGRGDAPRILWGLLRLSGKAHCDAGLLVATKTEERTQQLLEEAVVRIVSEAGVAYPRDIRRELINSYDYRLSPSYISCLISSGVARGLLRRLPASLYCPASMPDDHLCEALRPYDRVITGLLADPEIFKLASEDAWLFARYCYRHDRLPDANRVLEELESRGDLSEDRRRGCNRLRDAIRSKLGSH